MDYNSQTPFTPIIIKECAYDFDVNGDFEEPDDNNTLTPLLRRITASPRLLSPKSILLSPTFSPADVSTFPTTPTIIKGRLAPPQLQQHQHYLKSPQRRGSPIAGFRRLRSPRISSPHIQSNISIRLELQTKYCHVAGNKSAVCNNKIGASKGDCKSSNLAERRRCRQLRLKELQRRYAVPIEIHAVAMPLSPRVDYLLRRVGMIRYRSLFQIEEVDFVVFRTLTQNDLQLLGIGNAEDREEIYKAVLMADLLVLERF
ncbi:uncharacterized protein [Eurosta solidaginis]|uniref:uncharacterized protein n=1 Tax=Eurosta solidaginis TaxID=178769 RepID=UPI003530F888